jgi:xyloglucan-specific exo-beta-1,4-glucanase
MKKGLQKVLGVPFAFLLLALFVSADSGTGVKSEAYDWKHVAIVGGGFIPGIVFNTAEKNLIYTRTDMGGAYRWNAETNSWIPLMDWVSFDEWNLLGCESLATDPVEPNRVYIAAGTYTNDWTSMNGTMLRSEDKGNTWKRTEMPFKFGGNMPGRSMGERLAIDPNKNSILFFGTRNGNGLWKSEDYGATWAKVKGFAATGNYVDPYFKDGIGIVWVVFDVKSGEAGKPTKTIYAGVADTETAIYKSTDAGETWAAVPGQPKDKFLPHHGVLASNGTLYISYSSTCGPYDGDKGDVWKLDTAKGSWKKISPVPSTSKDDYFGYGGLSVDAKNPDVVMVASLNSWWPDCMIYRSTDGGASWTNAWGWVNYPVRNFKYKLDISAAPWLDWGTKKAPPESSPKLGWMTGCLVIDPFNSDRMMYGTGATIYGTENLTDWDKKGAFVNIKVMAQGIEETSINALVSPPQGAQLLSGIGDVCGFRHDDVTKVPKTMMIKPTFGGSTSIDFAETTPDVVVRVGWADRDYGHDQAIGVSADGGKTWAPGKDIPGFATKGGVGAGTVAIATDASVIVWAPESDKAAVSYSSDGGKTWTPSKGIPAKARVASDRINPKKFYGFSEGKFYLSTDGGVTFTESKAAGLPSKGSVRFKPVPGIEGDIWLTGGTVKDGIYGMWHSTDSGGSFSSIPDATEADTIGFGKAATGKTYPAIYSNAKIKGVRGIFRSDDKGSTWVRINDDAHQYGCANADITGDPNLYGRVYLATNGRGIPYGDPLK